MKNKSVIKAWSLGVVNFLLVMLAAALGADSAFAMSEVVVNNQSPEFVEDSKGDATQNPGEGASQTTAVETDFTPEEIDSAIAEFQAYQTPVNASIASLAEVVSVDSYEVIHYRTATPVFTVSTINASAVESDTTGAEQEIELTIGTDISKKMARLLYECKSIFVKEGVGYDEDGNPDGMLALYVLKNGHDAGSKIVFRVLNPDASGTNKSKIPAKSTLIIGAVAASESQREVAPDNFEPVPNKVYLQKRIFNIVVTHEWLEGKKKIKFSEEDLRKGALYNYKINNEISDLIGVQSKFKVDAGRQMAPEYVYTSRGLLRQINMYYSFDDTKGLQATDLTAIAKMQFTKFSANNEAQVFCGQDFIEQLLNMDLTVHREIRFEDVSFGGMSMKGWKNNFGTLNFVYTPVFDLLGFEKCALVVDLKSARKYNKRGPKMESVDMRTGAAETREAKRDIYSQIYAVALRGYNAMLVGPASEMASVGIALNNLTTTVTSISALPGEPSSDTVYYLTKAAGSFKAGSFIEYDSESSSWKLYAPNYVRV